jgi:2,5-furandicarboxylate decarboxylase 1
MVLSQVGLQEYIESLKSEHPSEVWQYNNSVPLDYFLTSCVLEMDKKNMYPVVLLNNVQGFSLPVVGNLFASRKRIASMLNITIQKFSEHWLKAENNPIKPIEKSDGLVKQIIHIGDEVNLSTLPIARHFLDDAGSYISSGIVVARDPDTGVYNLSYHRLQLKARNKLGISLHSRGHLWDYYRRAEGKGLPLEVAVIIGCNPIVYLAAGSKIGIEDDEYALAGALMGEPLELTSCVTVNIGVPANSEIVLEGRILPYIREPEGPFGEYTGYSTSRSTENVLEVSAILQRKAPYYLDLIPGYSQEHLLLGRVAKEAHVVERIKEKVPTLKALNFPKSGTHYHAYLSFKKTAEGQAKHALMLLFGLDPYLKLAIAVDDDIDVFNEQEVLWAMATRMQADKDVFIVPDMLCNVLDPSSKDGMSAKMGIDATAPMQWDVIRCKTNTETDALVAKIFDKEKRKR